MAYDTTTTSIRLQSAFILLLGLGLIAFGFGTVLSRAYLALDGAIVQSRTDCDPSNRLRCSTTYVIVGSSGAVTYSAGPNAPSLQTSLPVGTIIKKERWHLDYSVNGTRVDDFGLGPALAIGTLGCVLGIVSGVLIVRPTLIPAGLRKSLIKLR
jgi:cytochrome c biogenesis protein CcdA